MINNETKNILFICTGNTCRSPMAEGIFNSLALEKGIAAHAASCGLAAENGIEASEYAQKVCAEIGVDISNHRSRMISNDLISSADIIIPMTEGMRHVLINRFGGEKIAPSANISDPYGGDIEIYRRCRNEITAMCNAYINEVLR